jgi:hypothetical protein
LDRSGVQHEVDVLVRGQRPARPGIAVKQHERRHVEQRDDQLRAQRRLLGRLEHHRVAGHERRGDLAARDRHRVVPRHQQRDHAARLVHHQVGRVPAALQAAPAVKRAKLRALLDRGDAGLDAPERVRQWLAALPCLELGQLSRVLAQPARSRLQRGGADRGSRARRPLCGAACRSRSSISPYPAYQLQTRRPVTHVTLTQPGSLQTEPILTMTRPERPDPMTSERTQAYGRVVKTLEDVGPAKLQPAEQERIRDAADTLIFAADLDESHAALEDILALAEHLSSTGRWTSESTEQLVQDLLACGPVEPVA